MCTQIIDYRFNFLYNYTGYYYYNNIVDLMHVRILKEHLCSQTITWLNKLLLLILLLLLLKDIGNEVSFIRKDSKVPAQKPFLKISRDFPIKVKKKSFKGINETMKWCREVTDTLRVCECILFLTHILILASY